MDYTNKPTHIAILPGTGHLNPLVEFVRRLLRHDPSLSMTFILIPTSSSDDTSSTPSALSALPATAIDTVTIPPPSLPTFSNISDQMFTSVLRTVHHSLPSLRQTLQELTCRRHVAALVIDIFATDIIQVGSELGIKSCIFHPSSATVLSLFLHLPKLKTGSNDEWELDRPLKVPGCPVVQVKDLPEPLLDRKSTYYKWCFDHFKNFELADAIALNSFEALEEGPIRALRAPGPGKPPVYAVGPLVGTGSRTDELDNRSGCLRWLDDQPPRSVLYVSFGSGGTLSSKQVTELAWGLELSEQRFLWVVRTPNDSVSYGTYLSMDKEKDPLGFLPKGFLERTRKRGLVVQSWAPQVEILSHSSTGGFMTHCGWNSTLEGMVSGVGFIAWPLYAEQRMNATKLAEDTRVALRVKKDEHGVAGQSEIAKVVRALMEGKEGKEIGARMERLKDEARLADDKGGSSDVALSELALLWKAQ